MNLEIANFGAYYPEMNQTKKISFSFIKKINEDNYKELHDPFTCRELINSVMIAGSLGIKEIEISGNCVSTEIDLDKLRMCCTIPTTEIPKFIKTLRILLKDIDKILKISLSDTTKIFEIEKHLGVYSNIVIISDKKWIESSLTFSIFTFILRLSLYGYSGTTIRKHLEELSNDNGNDYILIKCVGIDHFEKVLENLDYIISENPLTNIDTESFLLKIKDIKCLDICKAFLINNRHMSLNTMSVSSGIFTAIENSSALQYYQEYSFPNKINEILNKLL